MQGFSASAAPHFGQAYKIQNVDLNQFNQRVVRRIPNSVSIPYTELSETGLRPDRCVLFVGPETQILANIERRYGVERQRQVADAILQQTNPPVIDMVV